MSKIICDVCGTRYPESAEQCPICGRVSADKDNVESTTVEGSYGREYSRTKGGHFSKANVKKRTKGTPVVEVPEEPKKPEAIKEDEEVYEVPAKKKGGCFVNFLLIIVILALLAVSAYIGLQYVAPGVLDDLNLNLNVDFITQFLEGTNNESTEATTEAPATEEATEESTEEVTTEPTVPCTDLVILDSLVMIDEVGQSYLLNAAVAPEDTTDTLMYISSDESIATVNGEGRITAVGAGEVTITVSCGEFSVDCKVLCVPGDITLPADGVTETEATEAAATASTEATTAPATTEATSATEATTAPTKPVQLKDVKLSVKATDVTFVHRGQRATFKLTCGLAANEVTWTSQDEKIITVDENGVATCVGYGTTNVIVSYGDQQVTIIVRCIKK